MERDGEKIFEYYDNSRLDGLLKLEVEAEYVREFYEHRQNRLVFNLFGTIIREMLLIINDTLGINYHKIQSFPVIPLQISYLSRICD